MNADANDDSEAWYPPPVQPNSSNRIPDPRDCTSCHRVATVKTPCSRGINSFLFSSMAQNPRVLRINLPYRTPNLSKEKLYSIFMEKSELSN